MTEPEVSHRGLKVRDPKRAGTRGQETSAKGSVQK
jgi:hypothetical protein